MSDFPRLRTGAVMQYPAERKTQYGTFVTRYVDGAEQRYSERAEPIQTWVIQLNLLSDEEMFRLQEFFMEQEGAASGFRFVDPWNGVAYENCVCGEPDFRWEWLDEDRSRGRLLIRNGARTS